LRGERQPGLKRASIPGKFRTFHVSTKTLRARRGDSGPMSKSQHRHSRTGRPQHPRLRAWRRLFAASRRGCAWLTLLASLGLGGPANAEIPDRWRPNPNVGLLEGVTLRIHWFESSAELREAAENSGQEMKEIGLKGFSILKRNTATGEYVCEVFVVKMTGAQIDGDRTTTFGHEMLHCFGLMHE